MMTREVIKPGNMGIYIIFISFCRGEGMFVRVGRFALACANDDMWTRAWRFVWNACRHRPSSLHSRLAGACGVAETRAHHLSSPSYSLLVRGRKKEINMPVEAMRAPIFTMILCNPPTPPVTSPSHLPPTSSYSIPMVHHIQQVN